MRTYAPMITETVKRGLFRAILYTNKISGSWVPNAEGFIGVNF